MTNPATSPWPVRTPGDPVPPLWPETSEVRVLISGEAPGRLGANESGVPFLGDRAGRLLYPALVQAGALDWPYPLDLLWQGGGGIRAAGGWPRLRGVVLTNAWDRCPLGGESRIRPPRPDELASTENQRRLAAERAEAARRGLALIVALGRAAERVWRPLAADTPLVTLPHPAAQGLLMAAPNRGRGARLVDLEAAWRERLVAVLAPHLAGV